MRRRFTWLSVPLLLAAGLSAAGVATGEVRPGQSSVTPDMIQRGDTIFHGAGRCTRCHGEDARGTKKAPALVAPKKWLNIQGGYEQIVQLVSRGVPEPKEYPAPMPARGKANLSDADVRDVAAYVFSISR